MEIVGDGMLARSFFTFQHKLENALIFASGVANSLCENQEEYKREIDLLYKTLQSCQEKGSRIVYFSSGGAVYGNFTGIKDESSPVFPRRMYGRHKLFCESVIIYSGVRYLILRLPNLVGRGQNRHQLIPALVTQAIEGYAKIYRDAKRDIIDVQDVATIVVSLLKKVDESVVLNVASGYSIPVLDIFSEIEAILGTSARVEILPGCDAQQFSISKLQSYLRDEIHFSPDYWRSAIRKNIFLDWKK